MDNRAEVREFLTTRRARLRPGDVGLPAGANRRVPGLRRSEVATLSGVSVEYYTKLERGAISGASPQILDALAKGLLLDDAERAHLFILRTEAGRDPHNNDLHDLIGELSTRSDEFRRLWGAHDVRHHGSGFKTFRHDIVGEVTLAYEGLTMEAEPGLSLTVYTAEPGSPSAERIELLASWAATHEQRPRTSGHEQRAASDDQH
ncbi:helix-turn-helix transcriptional regulator [Gordonia iterans]